ncbi:GGL domain-containing protein [Phaeosphaeria sp. MPI-PUGE-AT-0046c]|nr:GGL domain-containing protein [Phaeosphaeria sp. MPI-PUGE-AT-0046c]
MHFLAGFLLTPRPFDRLRSLTSATSLVTATPHAARSTSHVASSPTHARAYFTSHVALPADVLSSSSSSSSQQIPTRIMPAMMAAAPYEIRTGGDGKSKKQSMAELKLRRLTELNQRLREDLERRRIPVSEAALDLIAFTDKEPKDWMVPSRWGTIDKREDPYAPQQSNGCCIVM